jgi:hypothetical protein
MSTVVAFKSGFLKKAQEIRLERSREEKIENKKSNTDSKIQRESELMRKVEHLLTEHRECKIPESVYNEWLSSGQDSGVIDKYMSGLGKWPTTLSDPEYTTWKYRTEAEVG